MLKADSKMFHDLCEEGIKDDKKDVFVDAFTEFIAELDKTVPKHNSVVVLMHDAGGKKATAEALPTIISYFRNQGFEFDNFYSIIK